MECPLCGHHKTHKHGKTRSGSQRFYCPICQQTFTETFDTLYYRRQRSPEKISTVLQAHSEGSSLRGVSRITDLSYNTVVSLVRAASVKGQIVNHYCDKSKKLSHTSLMHYLLNYLPPTVMESTLI